MSIAIYILFGIIIGFIAGIAFAFLAFFIVSKNEFKIKKNVEELERKSQNKDKAYFIGLSEEEQEFQDSLKEYESKKQ